MLSSLFRLTNQLLVVYLAAVSVSVGKDKKAYFHKASMVSKEPKESFPNKRNSQWYSQKFSELRTHLGISQAVMASKLGVSGAAIGQLERGESKSPSADLLGALASILSVNLDWLLNGEGEMLKPTSSQHAETKSVTTPVTEQAPQAPAINPDVVRGSKATHAAGMTVRDYHLKGEGEKKPTPPIANQPTPAGTDLVQLVAQHDARLAKYDDQLAELRQLIADLQQP